MFELIHRRRHSIKDDVLSGLTVALALVPEAISFAFVAGVEPLVGLYAALPYVVNAKSMCVSSSSWMTSGRPPPVAYTCGSMRSVRSSHDFSQELPLPAASHDVRYVLRMR